jgi:hypothetical protein
MNNLTEQLNPVNETIEGEKKIRLAYQQVFNSSAGRIVLEDMLFNLYFVQPCETPEQQARCNYAKELLALIYDQPVSIHKIIEIVEKLLKRMKRRTK